MPANGVDDGSGVDRAQGAPGQHHSGELLATVGLRLLETRTEGEIFELASEYLSAIMPGAIVLLSALDPGGESVTIRAIGGADESLRAQAAALLGSDPVNQSYPVRASTRRRLVGHRLERFDGGLVEALSEVLPVYLCNALERLLGLGAVYHIGIADEAKALGMIHLLMRETAPEPPTHLVESFCYQCFLRLDNLRTTAEIERRANENARLVANMAEGLVVCELLFNDHGVPIDYRYLFANEAAQSITARKASELIGFTLMERDPESAFLIDRFAPVVLEGRVVRFDVYRERLGRHLSVTGYPLDGERFAFLVSDDTERVAMLEELESSKRKYASAFMTSPDALAITRVRDGLYRDCNDGFCRLTGYRRDQVVGATVADISIWADERDRSRLLEGLREDGLVTDLEATFRRSDGSTLVGLMSARPIEVDGEPHILSITRDVSEIREARERERDYAARLSALASELTSAENRERRQLAEELHDRVSQPLAVAKMYLDMVSRGESRNAADELEAASALLRGAIGETRAITDQLAPPVLYELGLAAAVRWYCDLVERRTGVKFAVEAEEGADTQDVETSEFAFQATMALISNVIKHTDVREAQVVLDRTDGWIQIEVIDRGEGFDSLAESDAYGRQGYGLFWLSERAAALGGGLTIESSTNGTRAVLRLPPVG